MDPTNPRQRALAPDIPFHATMNQGADRASAEKPALDFSLSDYESLAGKPMVTRHGIFRYSFRNNGPEIGENTIPNG